MWEVNQQANITTFNLFDKNLNYFNLEALENTINKIKSKKIILLLNFPNNPTGYMPNNNEVEMLNNIIKNKADEGKNILVICDDAYFGMTYEQESYTQSVFSKLSTCHKNVLAAKVDGMTKEAFMWGFRVGFLTFGGKNLNNETCKALEQKCLGLIRSQISSTSHIGQSIAEKVLNDSNLEQEVRKKVELLHERYQETKKICFEEKYKELWKVYPFNSGYFMCLQIKKVDAEKLRVHLLEKYGLGIIKINSTDIRIAFSCLEKNEIKDVFEIIALGINELSDT